MCETNIEFNSENLPIWRSYGQDGNGVAIVLSFNKRFVRDWLHIMLSKVYYNPRYFEKILKINDGYAAFKAKYNLTINNFDELFYRYFAFHKNKIYSDEREVRLIYCQGFNSYDEPPIKWDINRRNEKTSYIELDIEWQWDEKTKAFVIQQGIEPKNIRPLISIDKVIFGYRLSSNAKWEISDVISMEVKNCKKAFQVIDSPLNKFFRSKV